MRKAKSIAKSATRITPRVNFSLLKKNVVIVFAEMPIKTFLISRLSSRGKATLSNALSKGVGKSLPKTWYKKLYRRKLLKNSSNSSRITRLLFQMTKSFALTHRANRLFKLLKIPRKFSVQHASVTCVLTVQLNGTRENHAMRLRKNFMRAGPMSLGLTGVPNVRFLLKKILDACI